MFGIAEQTSGRCSVQWRQMFDTVDGKQMFGADETDVWYMRHVWYIRCETDVWYRTKGCLV